MYTFLLGASINNDISLNMQCSMQVTKKLFDSFGFPTVISKKFIPEMNVRWFCLTPEVDNKVDLISEYANEQVVLIVFGHVYAVNGTNQNAALAVFEAWKKDGIDAVRSLDGCFSAVIVDLIKHIIYITSDIIGNRSLRFFNNKNTLLVSVHDIPIIATGLCATELDTVSAGSSVLFDWSFGGKSMLKDITVCSPFDYYTWCNGDFNRTHKPLLKTSERIDANDKNGIKRQVDLMIGNMRRNTRHFCGDNSNIYMELTAGIDSRVILAILLSVVDASRITAVTAGHKYSLDVKTAKLLADKCNVKYEYSAPDFPDKDIFLKNTKILAFFMNGDTSGKRAITGGYSYDATPKLGGNSGEIFSGAFYNYFYAKSDLFDVVNFFEFLQKILSNGNELSWKDEHIPESINRRLEGAINLYRKMCTKEYDILDFFYLFERCARWGSMNAQFTWMPNKFSPFESPGLVRLAFKLPPPIGYHYLFHRTIIERFLPASKYLPINEKNILPLLSHSPYARLLSGIIRCSMRYKRKAVVCFTSSDELHDHEQDRSEMFSCLLNDDIRDILLAEKSIGCEMFKKKSLIKIIDDHIAGKRNNLNVIGNLIGIESFRLLINEVTKARKLMVAP